MRASSRYPYRRSPDLTLCWIPTDVRRPTWRLRSAGDAGFGRGGRRPYVAILEQSEQLITVDGTPEPFLTLSTPTGRWVAVRRHDDLTITVAAHDLDPTTITLEPIPDPASRLLGPKPEEP